MLSAETQSQRDTTRFQVLTIMQSPKPDVDFNDMNYIIQILILSFLQT